MPELNIGILEQVGVSTLELPRDGDPLQLSPIGAIDSPSYADITKKKHIESSNSSEDDTFEQPSKKASRKSHKEARDEEAERLNMQGIHSTIEMSFEKGKRTRPPKGVITPSNLGK